MSISYLSKQIKDAVAERAGYRCEYCKALRIETYSSFQVDHIISEQHGGLTDLYNLALSCRRCNLLKGPNLASKLSPGGAVIPLFHPRQAEWTEHFAVDASGIIKGLTEVGIVTANLLQFNTPPRIEARRLLFAEHKYTF